MRLRRSRRVSSMTHIQNTCPKDSLRCSSKGWCQGAGTVPMAGMRMRWKSTQMAKPNTAPCHSLTRGCFSASSAYTTAKKIENPKWTMKLTKGSGHPLKVYDM